MSIVIATTTIAVNRPARPATEDPWGEGYDAAAARDNTTSTVATGIRATIAPGGASGSSVGGESQTIEFRLTCDPCPLAYGDTVTDETTGQLFDVEWAVETPGVEGLGHIAAGLRQTKGRSQ